MYVCIYIISIKAYFSDSDFNSVNYIYITT